MLPMRIGIVGTGYVGLVAGVCFSDTGQFVTCVDKDQSKVKLLSAGTPTIYEPGLAELLQRNIHANRLTFTSDLASTVRDCSVIFVAVGTPPLPDGSVDMSQVMDVAHAVADNAKSDKTIVMKSTVPLGTHLLVSEVLAKASCKIDYVSNPEFLKEGNAIEDFTKPDRVIIGSFSDQARKAVAELYAPFMRQSERFIMTDPATAEMSKYAANAMLAVRITFMNEVARLCDTVSANVDDVRKALGTDKRIGPAFLFPGLGYGGFCFPKDVQALAKIGQAKNCPMHIVEATHISNLQQVDYFQGIIDRHFRGDIRGKRFALWGLAYKARTDDVRMSPAIRVARWLVQHGASAVAHDPQAMEKARNELGDSVEFHDDMYAMLTGADALIVLTDWTEFRNPDLDRVKAELKTPLVFDGRNLYSPALMLRQGFVYYSVGRPHRETNAAGGSQHD